MTPTRKPFLPFALPDIGEEEIAGVVETLRSGWLTTGPKTQEFERRFAAFIGDGLEAVAVNSATAGLHLALEAAGIGSGDEVITTTNTFTATAEVVRYLGAHPVLVDIDPATLNLDIEAVERAVTPRTKAILPVHFGGLACDMTRLLDIARRRGLRVVEDAAHALPATHEGALIGTLASDATVFSFYATKTITTGEGGMVVTRDAALARRCRVMRLHGIDRNVFNRYVSSESPWYYEVLAPGFKYNMTDIAAAIGMPQLAKAHDFHRRRRALAARYDAALAGLPLELPPRGRDDAHAWHLYVIRLRSEAGIERSAFIARMAELGVGCSVHFIPLHLQPYWRDTYRLRAEDFPAATASFQRSVSLPIYTRMSDEDQDRVVAAIRRLLGGA